MSNLGFLNLFHHASHIQGIRTARFFITRDGKLFSPEANDPIKKILFSPLPLSLATFDAVLFSLSFEMDYINMYRMLMASSLHPLAEKRRTSDPLIVAGGIAPTANPAILSAYADLVFRGDLEAVIDDFFTLLLHYDFKKTDEFFSTIEKRHGFIIKNEKNVASKRSVIRHIMKPAHSVIITPHTVFASRLLIEIARGCRNRCTFCMTRVAAAPPRVINIQSIIDAAEKARPYTGTVGLIAPVLTDNYDLVAIVDALNDIGFRVSFSSLRADFFSHEVAHLLHKNMQHTVTFAPETGSEKLRTYIGKLLTDKQILTAVSRGLSHRVRNFRYYFMYGLPTEAVADIKAIVTLVMQTLSLLHTYNATLHLSINPFIPKKGTALFEAPIHTVDYYQKVQTFLKNSFQGIQNLTIRFESLRHIYTHYMLSVGTRDSAFELYNFLEKNKLQRYEKYLGEKLQGELIHGTPEI